MTITDAPTTPRGFTGGDAPGSGYFAVLSDLLEQIPELRWPESIRTYAQMRHDPQLSAVLAAYFLPLRRASWHVNADGCRPDVARQVADDIGLPLAGEKPTASGARRRGVSWPEHMRVAVQHLTYGHMPFELGATIVEQAGRQVARLTSLTELLPQTVLVIETEPTGALKLIKQAPVDSSQAPPITADRLTWYCHEREGAHWQGRSLLRPAYASWLIKQEMIRVHATSNRRFGMGVPGFEVAPGTNVTPAQLAEANRLAQTIKVSDKGGYAAPPGFQLVIKGLSGAVPDTLSFVRYLDQQMARQALAGLLDLGDTPNGSRALGEAFLDMFLLSLQAIGDAMAATATQEIAVRIVDWNWGTDQAVPQIVCGDVGADHAVTAQSLQLLMSSGALSADPSLEQYVRQRWQIPQRATPAPAVPAAASRPSRRVAAAAPPLRRQPTAVEAAAKTDFTAVQADWESALDVLVNDWDSISRAQRQQLADQITTVVDNGDVAALATLAVDSQDAAALLEARMTDLAAAAVDQAAGEAQSQNVPVDVATAVIDADRIAGAATAAASFMGAGLAAAAGRKALQVWSPGATGAQVAGEVLNYLGSLTDASLRDGLGAGLSVAQGEGRAALFAAAPQATYFASEILDANACSNCIAVDGTEYATWDDASAAYASGGFVDCEGGLRCRGVVVAVWDMATVQDEAA